MLRIRRRQRVRVQEVRFAFLESFPSCLNCRSQFRFGHGDARARTQSIDCVTVAEAVDVGPPPKAIRATLTEERDHQYLRLQDRERSRKWQEQREVFCVKGRSL